MIAISQTLAVLDEDVVGGIGQRRSRRVREACVVGQPPQQRMGVDEQPGHAVYSAKSSGVSSKSSAIVIRPFSAPGTRGVVGAW